MSRYSTYGRLDNRIEKEGDVGFVGFNNRLRPDQLQSGLLADAQNIRIDRNGQAQVRKGIDLITNPLVAGSSALILPFYLVANDTSVTVNRNNSGEVVITNVNAANFSTNGTVNITGVTDLNPVVNGDRPFTKNSDTQITISDQSYSGTAGGTATVKFGIINNDAVESIYGSCSFSDPNSVGSQYIIFASNGKAIAINLETLVSTDIVYPTGFNISEEASMIQAFNKVFIFRNGKEALEWNGSFSGTPAFTKVQSGTYSQPALLTTPSSGFSIANNIATVDLGSTAHNLLEGDIIKILSSSNSTLTEGDTFVVATIVDANEFKFFVTADNLSAASNITPRFSRSASVGMGFTHMPAPPFAVYHQRRLFMPFNFTVDSGLANQGTFTSRGILDEVIGSRVLDTNTYDQFASQFRFNAGTSDFVVGMHSFTDDSLIVFNRNSIHLIQNTTSLGSSSNKLLTDEIGCVARESIEQVGNRILFLSDNGVYGTEFLDEYNLRGTQTPLSEPINSTIERINKNAKSKSVSVYFDNRYYLAVPLDTSSKNNAILIYNFLNNQWESIDSVKSTNFNISNMFVVGEGDSRGIYIINDLGGIFRLDARNDDKDTIVSQIGGAQENIIIPASITTRQYTVKSLDRKKWRDFDFHVQSSDVNVSDFDIVVETENPDSSDVLGKLSDYNTPKETEEISTDGKLDIGEDVSIRGRIGNRRGYGIQFTINNTIGRPMIRAIEVEGSTAMRSTDKAI